MTAETFFQLFNQYGLILVCAVVFCEYMNLPGFPAGVIMPCVGAWSPVCSAVWSSTPCATGAANR